MRSSIESTSESSGTATVKTSLSSREIARRAAPCDAPMRVDSTVTTPYSTCSAIGCCTNDPGPFAWERLYLQFLFCNVPILGDKEPDERDGVLIREKQGYLSRFLRRSRPCLIATSARGCHQRRHEDRCDEPGSLTNCGPRPRKSPPSGRTIRPVAITGAQARKSSQRRIRSPCGSSGFADRAVKFAAQKHFTDDWHSTKRGPASRRRRPQRTPRRCHTRNTSLPYPFAPRGLESMSAPSVANTALRREHRYPRGVGGRRDEVAHERRRDQVADLVVDNVLEKRPSQRLDRFAL